MKKIKQKKVQSTKNAVKAELRRIGLENGTYMPKSKVIPTKKQKERDKKWRPD